MRPCTTHAPMHPCVHAQVHPQEQGPELTTRLFQLGSALLLKHLPSVLSGQGRVEAQAQDELQATRAAKASVGGAA